MSHAGTTNGVMSFGRWHLYVPAACIYLRMLVYYNKINPLLLTCKVVSKPYLIFFFHEHKRDVWINEHSKDTLILLYFSFFLLSFYQRMVFGKFLVKKKKKTKIESVPHRQARVSWSTGHSGCLISRSFFTFPP